MFSNLQPLLESIVSFIDEGVIIADQNGSVLYQNPACQPLLGLSAEKPISTIKQIGPFNLQKRLLKAAIEAGEVDAAGRPSGRFVRFTERLEIGNEARYLDFHSGLVELSDHKTRLRLVLIMDRTEQHRLATVLNKQSHPDVVSADPAMNDIINRIQHIAPTNAFVLFQGESGTGKTRLARMVHQLSHRQPAPFIEVNCAAIPDNLIESELFGHVKGAFTGAIQERSGRFQAANKGTLFLDEISEIPLNLQAKLLRAIQDQQFEMVGSDKSKQVDIRIIAASNRNLREQVENGQFRADLYYRLAVIPLNVPPLRERPGDIPLLIEHFLVQLYDRGYRFQAELSAAARRMLMDYPWPGNVRELENAVEHGLICHEQGQITPTSLPQDIRCYGETAPHRDTSHSPVEAPKGETFDQEKNRILDALDQAKGSRSVAAKILGIDRSTLWRRMLKYGIR